LDVVRKAVPKEAEYEGEHDDKENLVDDFDHLLDLVVKSQLVVLVVAVIEGENELLNYAGWDEFRVDSDETQ